jgi:hypothetical protein
MIFYTFLDELEKITEKLEKSTSVANTFVVENHGLHEFF